MNKRPAQCVGILLLCYPVIAILSTIAKVMVPEWKGHALLSHESIRHLAGQIVNDLANPIIVYAIMAAVVVGNIRHICKRPCQHTLAATTVKTISTLIVELVLFAAVIYIIALQPHAPLRGIDGNIMSKAFVGLLPFLILLISIIFSTTIICTTTPVKTWTETYRIIIKSLIHFIPWVIPLMLFLHLVTTILYMLGK